MKLLVLFSAFLALAHAQCDPPNTIDDLGVTCPTDQQDTAVTYADVSHCSEYWECYNGCATHQICDQDYLYDDFYGYCNYPEDVICDDRDCDERDCMDNYILDIDEDFACEEPEAFYEYPDNCIKRIHCHSNYAMVELCETSGEQQLYWCQTCDEGKGWCDFPENVDCGDRPVCDVNDENCGSDTGGGGSNFCDSVTCTSDGYVEEGPCEQCTCRCENDLPEELCCGEGLSWNPETEQCSNGADNPGCS